MSEQPAAAHDWSRLPRPEPDGACDHLPGSAFPHLRLHATTGGLVDLAAESHAAPVLLFIFPRAGRPDRQTPDGWDRIPGARGCTPQSCAMRDHHAELTARGLRVYGLSAMSTAWHQEQVQRLHLPYPVLSDASGRLAEALHLPTFEAGGMRLIKRLSLYIRGGSIEHVFYPVFPPDAHAQDVLGWLGRRARA